MKTILSVALGGIFAAASCILQLCAQEPDFIWATKPEGQYTGGGRGITLDPVRNIYVTGWFLGAAAFGNTSLTNSDYVAMFLAKYDPSANVLWAQRAGGTGHVKGESVALDGVHHVYVTGSFQGTAHFDSASLTSHGDEDIFIAQYNLSGNLLWARQAGGNGMDRGRGIAADAQGNCYVTGFFSSQADFGETNLNSIGLHDLFVAKWDPTGILQWVRQAGDSSYAEGAGIAVDTAGNVFLTGTLSEDVLTAKYNNAGNLIWSQKYGSEFHYISYATNYGTDHGHAVALDTAGNCYITGSSGYIGILNNTWDIFVAKYSGAGVLQWTRTTWGASHGRDGGNGIVVDGEGKVLVVGNYGAGYVSMSGVRDDLFITKYSGNGDLIWNRKSHSTNQLGGAAIAVETEGNSYVTGFFSGTAPFGTTNLAASSSSQVFVAKLGTALGLSSPAITVGPKNQTVRSGESVTFTVTATGYPAPIYQWRFNGTNLVGATNSVLVISCASPSQAGSYSVVVSNSVGSITSAPALLTVLVPPHILVQPVSQTVVEGTEVTFTVVAEGSPPLHYEWWRNGQPIQGETNAALVRFGHPDYSGYFAVKISNEGGRVESDVVWLTVLYHPSINYPTGYSPRIWTVPDGVPVHFYMSADGTLPIYYQWQFNGQAIPGETNYDLILPEVSIDDDGDYSMVASNQFGSDTSYPIRLLILDRINSTAQVTTLAGTGIEGYRDGPGYTAQFSFINGGCVDAAGSVYIADELYNRIRKIAADGTVTTLAGTGVAGYADGAVDTAQLNYPIGMGLDNAGNLYVAEPGNQRIRKIGLDGQVTTVAGNGQAGYRDGPSLSASFNFPNDLVVDPAGNIYVSDHLNHAIRKISPDGMVRTVAGNGEAGYVDGPAGEARFNKPAGLARDAAGNLFVTEYGNQRIRKITPDGLVSTVAGSGLAGFVDGMATEARFNEPDGIVTDSDGNLFITDSRNHAIRMIAPEGEVRTVAGNGVPGWPDGSFDLAQFSEPSGIGLDRAGNLYVADRGSRRVRKIALAGALTIIRQPKSQTVIVGSEARFTCEVIGAPPVTYQWRKDASIIPGATGAVYPLGKVTADAAGIYDVTVSNSAGRITSSHAALKVISAPAFVKRLLPSAYSPAGALRVVLQAEPSTNTTVYAVEEQPPAGWEARAMSDGGSFDAINQRIKWGPFFDHTWRTLSYELTPPLGDTGMKKFAGSASADGLSSPISGNDTIGPALTHPADNNPTDNRLAMNEVTAYGAAWRKGSNWLIAPNPIPIDFVTRAGALWKNGEIYYFDSSVSNAPLWWINSPAPSVPGLHGFRSSLDSPITGGSALSLVPTFCVPTESFLVSISVKAGLGVSVYAVQDQIPVGWAVSAISHNGEFDAVNRQVKWGPFFDSTARELSYRLTPPKEATGILSLVGVASFDGSSIPIAGSRLIQPTSRLTLSRAPAGETFRLNLLGAVGARYNLLASTNLVDWMPLTEATNLMDAAEFLDRETAKYGRRFYRARQSP